MPITIMTIIPTIVVTILLLQYYYDNNDNYYYYYYYYSCYYGCSVILAIAILARPQLYLGTLLSSASFSKGVSGTYLKGWYCVMQS